MELNPSTADPVPSTLNAYAMTFRKLSLPNSTGQLLTGTLSEGKQQRSEDVGAAGKRPCFKYSEKL